jgi:glutamate-1-semialdehyde aminotransferase
MPWVTITSGGWTGGFCATLPSEYEEDVAKQLALLLGDRVPGWLPDDVGIRFCKSGSDATTMAIRLVRAVTGREKVLTFENGYHGWHSWTVGRTDPAWGITSYERLDSYSCGVQWDDRNSLCLQATPKQYAAVIFEHPAIDADPDWYKLLRKWCDKHGILLIADEVVTGLRYAPGGACERYGIEPDIVCLGKGLGNGAEVAAVAGRKEYMDWFARTDPVFCSSTTWGNPLPLACAGWVLHHWNDSKVRDLWETGERLMTGLREAGWDVFGHGARSVLRFTSPQEQAFFIHDMFARGFMMNRPNFPCLAMTVDDEYRTVTAATETRNVYEQLGGTGSGNGRQVAEGAI